MKFRPTPNLLTGIFMGIFSLTTLSTMAEKAVKPYWQDVQVVEEQRVSTYFFYDIQQSR